MKALHSHLPQIIEDTENELSHVMFWSNTFGHHTKWIKWLNEVNMVTQKTRNRHNAEFKAEALKLVEQVGVAEVAR